MRVVICGGGAIGSATAYYLSRRDAQVTLVERTAVACASSGKAGAFLALDWNTGSRLDWLARRSFQLHAELPQQIEGDWGFQRLSTYGGYTVSDRTAGGRRGSDLPWLSERVVLSNQIGSPETTASIHPRAFTEALVRAAQANGAELRIGQVTGMVRAEDGARIRGVQVDGEMIEADAVVIAMGPWSVVAAGWLPLPGVLAYKGHSLIFQTGTTVSPDALFLEVQTSSGAVLTPEVFPRADGTTYVAYSSVQDALPLDSAEVTTDPQAVAQLEALCARLSPALVESNIVARQACYRPVTRDGLPLIGKVPGVEGAYVATGHSVWGVLNAPATGEALAELIVDGTATTTDLRPFDPGRLRPLNSHSIP